MAYMPFISVTVNLYNYGRYIKDCIQSILNQNYKNFELIVVDDYSKDDSYKIAKKFEQKDNRVKVIKLNKNEGIGHAKNEGIIKSKGEYIVTLDADDMMTKNSLEVRLEAALKYDVPFVYADTIWFRNMNLQEVYEIKYYGVDHKNLPKRHNSKDIYSIQAATVLVSRSVYEKYGLYDEDLECKVDREMWNRLFGKKGIDDPRIKSFHLNEVVGYYRWHSKQISKKRQKDFKFNKINTKLCEDKYFDRKDIIDRSNTRFI